MSQQMSLQDALALGLSHHRAGRLADAEQVYRQVLAAVPDNADALHLLGVVAHQAGRHDDALQLIDRALAITPAVAPYHSNRARVLMFMKREAEARAAYEKTLELAPDHMEAVAGLGALLASMGQAEEAIPLLERAAAAAPHLSEPLQTLASVRKSVGDVAGAIACYRTLIERFPHDPAFYSMYLLATQYLDTIDPRANFQEHLRYDQRYARGPVLPPTFLGSRDPARPLRIAFLSPDLFTHSVAFFLEPLLEHLDRARCHVTCYALVDQTDATTRRLAALSDQWRHVQSLGNDDLAAQIRFDCIDVLVDLAGHMRNNRLTVFPLRCAPVQMTWLGYPNTTGLQAMDYRLTDPLADPPRQTDALHSEKLLRLPRSAWCYRPPADLPDLSPPPAAASGHVTFGSFNHRAKFSRRCIELWARVLQAVPGSRAIFKAQGVAGARATQTLRDAFAAHNIAGDRISLVSRVDSLAGHLAAYAQLDIALDTFPYHGTTTTCEALAMGVPVVTMAGTTHASRVGASLLTSAGLPELIAPDADSFVRIAAALAADTPRLSALRAGMRHRLKASPLCDEPAFARDFLATLQSAWAAYCAPTPDAI